MSLFYFLAVAIFVFLFVCCNINNNNNNKHNTSNYNNTTSIFFYLCIFVQGREQPTQSQLIQIYSVDWTDVYDTYNIEHRTEPVSH